MGICAGGGYAVQAALTDRRFRALATVVASDIGGAFRRMGLASQLEEASRQRIREARGGPARRDPWIPDSLKEAEGIDDPEVLEAVSFYRESSYRHSRSTNRLLFTSYLQLIGFDALHLVPELLVLPLLVIVAGRHGNTGQFELGQRLYESAPGSDNHWFVVEDAGHYELYHEPEAVAAAVDRLVTFFSERLSP